MYLYDKAKHCSLYIGVTGCFIFKITDESFE